MPRGYADLARQIVIWLAFYFGYLAFQLPANLFLPRVGARRWIALLLIFWGLVSCATLSVTDSMSLYMMRILLGVAQAGFFPGVILYLTYWFPNRERARVICRSIRRSQNSAKFGF